MAAFTSGSNPRAVLGGRFAECAIIATGGTLLVVGFCYEWTVKFTTPTFDVTAHGDIWEYNAPGPTRWVFTAKQYVPVTAVHSGNSLYTRTAFVTQFDVAGYSGTVAGGTKVFQGTGTPTSWELNAPMELATQGFEIQGNGAPATAGGMS